MKPGQIVDGRFTLARIAGAGGMGVVYRALDRETGANVALKMLGRGAGADAERFQREVEVLEALEHPAIVRHVAHGVTEDGELYLAMEWLEGEDLATRLARGRLSTPESLALAKRIAEALAFAHGRGVVHRDLKPANIFLPTGDAASAKLLDFGVARRLASMHRTGTGAILGTPGYMAPEQARGEGAVDARADVFALGCVLVECLAGRPVFGGDHPLAILAKVLFEDTPKIDEMVPGLAPRAGELLTRMLAKNPAERPSNGEDVLAALNELDPSEEGARPAPSGRTIGLREQRFLSVVIAVDRGGREERAAGVLEGLRPIAARFGLELETLADGSLVATMTSTGMASDRASRCARFALVLRSEMPGAIFALSTGKGFFDARTPIGPVIDRAASLAAGAKNSLLEARGVIRIDEVTAGLLEPHFIIERGDGGIFLRGERGPFDTARTLLGRPTPCVGRERDLAWLDGIFAECAEEMAARVALVTAPPGMGKSRLRHEWLRRMRGRRENASILIARGDPIREGVPYGLVATAVRGAWGLPEAVDTADAIIEISQKFHAFKADEDRTMAIFLAELVGLPFPEVFSAELRAARKEPSLMAERIRAAFQWFVKLETADRAVLLVLEDLHWADAASVRLVDAALRDVPDRPWMVVGFGRPEVATRFPRLWAERGAVEARLRELPRRAAAELGRVILGEDVSEETLSQLAAQSGGNALYLEELLRSFAEGRREGLPETLLAMVESRIAALDAETRQIARAASILGEVFWRSGVAALLAQSPEDKGIQAALETLVSREIIAARPKSRFSQHNEYSFRHATLREAAYSTLTEHDRAIGHLRAAEWFLEMAGEERLVLAEAAEHAEQAGRLFVAVGEMDEAATAYGRAGVLRDRIGHADAASR